MQSLITIRLPYRLSIKDQSGFVSGYGEWDYKAIFYQWDLTITGVGWFGEPFPVTVVEIKANTTRFGDIDHPIPNEIIREFFIGTLAYLNRLIDNYRIATGDYHARNIVLGDLPPLVDIFINDNRYLYIVNVPHWIASDLRGDKTDLLDSMGAYMQTWDKWPQFMVVQKFFTSARQYFEQGNYFNAIIDLETAFEVKVRMALSMIVKKLGIEGFDDKRLAKIALRHIIEDHLSKHLGGDFSFNGSGPINAWFLNLYLLRNRCIHEGMFDISGEEAVAAFSAFHVVDNYLGEKLLEKGILKDNFQITMNEYSAKREIEVHEDIIKERLIKAGFIPDDSKFIRRQEDYLLLRNSDDE